MRRVIQDGFSLLESLVALAVLSIGLLGSAGILLSALRQQSQALRLSTAMLLVADAAERVRSHLQAGLAFSVEPGSPGNLDLAAFRESALRAFPLLAPQTSIIFEPAIGPASPGRYFISLRLRDPDAQDEVATLEVPLTVLAQLPVAG